MQAESQILHPHYRGTRDLKGSVKTGQDRTGVCVCVCVDSYNLSSHYRSLVLRGAPRLGVVVTLVSISKIIGEADLILE